MEQSTEPGLSLSGWGCSEWGWGSSMRFAGLVVHPQVPVRCQTIGEDAKFSGLSEALKANSSAKLGSSESRNPCVAFGEPSSKKTFSFT